MSTLESLVPSLDLCRPIAHLFPESVFVWAKGIEGGWFVSNRAGGIDDDGVIASPTISEMMLILKGDYLMIVDYQNHFEVANVPDYSMEPIDMIGPETHHLSREDAWASLIKWQLDQGLIIKQK